MAKKKSAPGKFDVVALHKALDTERDLRELTWKDVAKETGVSASTFSRLAQGRRPDVDSLAALTAWLKVSADHFMGSKLAFGSAAPLTQISRILRDDPNLTEEGAVALDELIKATYKRLRLQQK